MYRTGQLACVDCTACDMSTTDADRIFFREGLVAFYQRDAEKLEECIREIPRIEFRDALILKAIPLLAVAPNLSQTTSASCLNRARDLFGRVSLNANSSIEYQFSSSLLGITTGTDLLAKNGILSSYLMFFKFGGVTGGKAKKALKEMYSECVDKTSFSDLELFVVENGLLALVDMRISKKQFERAQPVAEFLVYRSPGHNIAWSRVGTVYAGMGMVDDAVHAFETSISLTPKGERPQCDLLPELYSRKNQHLKALAAHFKYTVDDKTKKNSDFLTKTLLQVHSSLP